MDGRSTRLAQAYPCAYDSCHQEPATPAKKGGIVEGSIQVTIAEQTRMGPTVVPGSDLRRVAKSPRAGYDQRSAVTTKVLPKDR